MIRRVLVAALVSNRLRDLRHAHVLHGFRPEDAHAPVAAAVAQHLAEDHVVGRGRLQAGAAGKERHPVRR